MSLGVNGALGSNECHRSVGEGRGDGEGRGGPVTVEKVMVVMAGSQATALTAAARLGERAVKVGVCGAAVT